MLGCMPTPRSDREPGSSPHLYAVPAPGPVSPLRDALGSGQWYAPMVRQLTAVVGGIDALEGLDTEPIPDEPFAWSTVLDRDRAFVAEVLEATDGSCDEWLDTEYRTIVRRLLALVASHDSRPLRRRTSATRFAAALVWLALNGNGDVGRRARWRAQDIWWRFGVTSCAGLGRSAHAAAGLASTDDDEWFALLPRGQLVLGEPGLLHSRFREVLVARRSRTEETVQRAAALHAAAQPIVSIGPDRLELRARPVEVLWTVKAMSTVGRAQVIVALGEPGDAPELLAFTVPQAHELRAAVSHALETSLVPPPS
jgi:hypothetical protein